MAVQQKPQTPPLSIPTAIKEPKEEIKAITSLNIPTKRFEKNMAQESELREVFKAASSQEKLDLKVMINKSKDRTEVKLKKLEEDQKSLNDKFKIRNIQLKILMEYLK